MVELGFVGDVYPGSGDSITIEPDVLRALASVDLLVANLEGPITDTLEKGADKGVRLRSAPASTQLLSQMGIDVAILANNHMFDFGVQGFHDTVDALDRAGIAWLGAGPALAEARRPLVTERAGLTIGLLAYSARSIETVCATDTSAGCAPLDDDLMAADLAALEADVSVVFLHWGLMGYELPTPEQRRGAQFLLDAGADLIVGCHPHVLQGASEVGPALVAHSLGDFAFYPESADGRPVDQHRARQTGALLTVRVEPGRVLGHELTLTRQRKAYVAFEASSRRHRAVARNWRRASSEMAGYARVWRRYVLRRTITRGMRRLAPWRWRTLSMAAIKGFGVALREMIRR